SSGIPSAGSGTAKRSTGAIPPFVTTISTSPCCPTGTDASTVAGETVTCASPHGTRAGALTRSTPAAMDRIMAFVKGLIRSPDHGQTLRGRAHPAYLCPYHVDPRRQRRSLEGQPVRAHLEAPFRERRHAPPKHVKDSDLYIRRLREHQRHHGRATRRVRVRRAQHVPHSQIHAWSIRGHRGLRATLAAFGP